MGVAERNRFADCDGYRFVSIAYYEGQCQGRSSGAVYEKSRAVRESNTADGINSSITSFPGSCRTGSDVRFAFCMAGLGCESAFKLRGGQRHYASLPMKVDNG